MATPVHDGGKDISVEVHLDTHGFILLKAIDDETGVELPAMPRMTPFEAGMLARDLQRASEKADTK